MIKAIYVDVDGTLTGPGGRLFSSESAEIVPALIRAEQAGVAIVPISGRGRVQMRELTRLLGLPRAIAELGCIHIEGHEVTYELGEFPTGSGSNPVEVLLERRAMAIASGVADLVPHDPWNENREVTLLMRGDANAERVNVALLQADMAWCQLTDNGVLARGGRAYHLAPKGTGKAEGVAADRARHGLSVDETAYVGDSAADLASRDEVGQLWLVANADPRLDGTRTLSPYGDGVAEVINRLID